MAVQVAEWKVREIENLRQLIEDYPVVGIVDMSNIPAKTIQRLRSDFRGEALIKMSKKRMMKYALNQASRGEREKIKDLQEHLKGQPAFIFSKTNSFKLYQMLKENMKPAPAKPNVEAPDNITIPKGSLGVPPGPLLGELQSLGVKTSIDGGKIAVKKDKVVVKKGEVIDKGTADILNKVGLEPLEVGLNLLASFEGGLIYLPEVLDIDREEVLNNLALAHRQAVNLSVNSGFLTRETWPLAIGKAHRDALALALEATIFEPGVMDQLFSRAYSQMLALASLLQEEALDEELKEKASSAPQPEQSEEEEEEEEGEEEEEASEEEAASGLGSLFG